MIKRLSRFALVGGLNTFIDIAVITLLSFLFPAHNLYQLLAYNTLACCVAAINSFFLNKFWTFGERTPITFRQVSKFAVVAIGGMILNDMVLSFFSFALPGLAYGTALDTLTLKIVVALTCMLLTFFAMRVMVFTRERNASIPQARLSGRFTRGISIILPAYNEEANIGRTVQNAVAYLSSSVIDYEIIVVNDGSRDHTKEAVERLTRMYERVKLINHPVNRGCGAALVTGFKAATKEFSFYMDSDGQFDIADISRLLPYASEYDGVFGYRYNRQDTWMRKLNAWGWNRVVRFFFHISIRDIDCAFKLFKTEYFHKVELEAKGAMLLTELVFKFDRAGYTFTEVPVRHFPRLEGKSTGAHPGVILKAFCEMFACASRWSQVQ